MDPVDHIILYHHTMFDVYLYHYSPNEIIDHFKYTVWERLRAIEEHEVRPVENVKAANMDFKLDYLRHSANSGRAI